MDLKRAMGMKGRIFLCIFIFSSVFLLISTVIYSVSTWKSNNRALNLVVFPSTDVEKIKINEDGIVLERRSDAGKNEEKSTKDNPTCGETEDNAKFDCHPEPDATENRCVQRGCCWKSSNGKSVVKGPSALAVPACYYPSNYDGYEITKSVENRNGFTATLSRKTPSGFPKDIKELRLDVTFLDENRLRFRITDANSVRYEVPVPVIKSKTKGRTGDENYEVNLENGRLKIVRKQSKVTILDANLASMIYADQLLQLNIKVPTAGFYGLGESQDRLKRGVSWKRFVLFARDRAPEVDKNLYGSHPFYMQIEDDTTSSHGVFLHNSNIMEIITQPTPGITFRPLGGIFDFYVMLGSNPSGVVKQYQDLIGRPHMPPYWSLGFHLCRYGFETLNNTKAAWQRNIDAKIPFDTMWNDIDYMDRYNDFTYDKVKFEGLPEFVDELHEANMQYVVILDVGVSGLEKPGEYPPLDDGLEMDIFVKNASGDVLQGKVWNTNITVFPDFTHPKAGEYLVKQYRNFYNEVKFDGSWIDMNEPSNLIAGSLWGCPGKDNELEYPPYIPQGIGEPILHTQTVCMSAKHYATTHYNVHNIHGLTNGIATHYALRQVMPEKRPFIVSRSTYAGQGFYTAHWNGDIWSNWEHLKWSIPSTLNMGMLGISMMGADICGFTGNTTMDLCSRWQSLGSFYPFSRNHNTIGTNDQDPAALGGTVLSATRKALTIRYRLLPYLYTLFHRSHVYGETLFRPLFIEFPTDKKTHDIDTTFLWGAAFMVVPILEEKTTSVKFYLPNDVWYNYYTGELMKEVGKELTLKAALDEINLLVRGGYILPAQSPALTTKESRKNDFELIVALKNGQAVGELFWDDGESPDTFENGNYNIINFEVSNNVLNATASVSGYHTNMTLGQVEIFGLTSPVKSVKINGDQTTNIKYSADLKALKISDIAASLLDPLQITWS